jgi:5'-methylthioadenosine phosphorylase
MPEPPVIRPSRSVALGVIGGSGMSLDAAGEPFLVPTPYGMTSSPVRFVDLDGVPAAFLARHGDGHDLPPHAINYRANAWAMAWLGAGVVVSLGAVGGLAPGLGVGDVVVVDQFVNRTWGRKDTFFDGPVVEHVTVSEPYCAPARGVVVRHATDAGLRVRDGGTVVAIQGPRYSTRAENRDGRALGHDVISMTQYPEVALVRELGLCFVALCLVTDLASVAGDPSSPPASLGHAEVERQSRRHRAALSQVVTAAAADLAGCACATLHRTSLPLPHGRRP